MPAHGDNKEQTLLVDFIIAFKFSANHVPAYYLYLARVGEGNHRPAFDIALVLVTIHI